MIDFLVAKIQPYIPGFVGAVLAAIIGPKRTRIERLAGFLIGFSISLYCTEPVIDFFNLSPFVYAGGIGFILGFFGMHVADVTIAILRGTDFVKLLTRR